MRTVYFGDIIHFDSESESCASDLEFEADSTFRDRHTAILDPNEVNIYFRLPVLLHHNWRQGSNSLSP
jgi:hypothetical protein